MADKRSLIHTPEGVRDIYGVECAEKLAVQEKILKVMYSYGYEHIQTPSFEFFDIFNQDRGSVSSREMFKFFDRDNETLVLRPDMTPAAARCVAKYYMDDPMPLRLCYLERTYKNDTSYQGRLKERTETGAELIGDNCADADAQMIAMLIHCLQAAGLKEFQVELGQSAFYQSLIQEAELDAQTQQELNQLIENKNYFGVEALLKELPMREDLKKAFLCLPTLFGPIERIRQAASLDLGTGAAKAIARLEEIHQILSDCGLEGYVTYDLGMLSNFKYYTGIIFKAYTHGTGDYIVTGGRYDKLLIQFGKDAPAVGFAIVVDRLMSALSRQQIHVPVKMANTLVLYEESARTEGIWLAGRLRDNGLYVQSMRRSQDRDLKDYRNMVKSRGMRNLLYLEGQGRVVRALDVVKDSEDLIPLSSYE